MKQSLHFRLAQQLALTPQLQQSIRLLQLSTLELNQELEQILVENPLLERLDDPLADCVRIAPNGGLDASPQAASDGPAEAAPTDGTRTDDAGQTASDGDAYGADDGDRGLEWSGSERGARSDARSAKDGRAVESSGCGGCQRQRSSAAEGGRQKERRGCGRQ